LVPKEPGVIGSALLEDQFNALGVAGARVVINCDHVVTWEGRGNEVTREFRKFDIPATHKDFAGRIELDDIGGVGNGTTITRCLNEMNVLKASVHGISFAAVRSSGEIAKDEASHDD